MSLWSRLFGRRSPHEAEEDGQAAARARVDAERKLREARRDWPAVHRAHDQLSEWITEALRGSR